ncbi:hypothetical protein [Hymenobacter sp. IS2118]|uniref:hypothetical protein n=1 Tax=Hymenobacter sp. IS2118 TaxID=1505605 RepID=UPI000691AF1C|nr:hypothetical protein [Hymenobacter sp. IS2118]
MKFLLQPLRIALLGLFALAATPAAHAQVIINVNPPSWGPAVPQGAQYYYIPETNGFYDVPARQYVVSRNGRWIRTTTLTGYNTANFHPVVVDYVGAQPWVRYQEYKVKYPKHDGHPHGKPPGQAKKGYKKGYVVVPANTGYYQYRDRKNYGTHGHKQKGKGHK